MNEIYIDYSNVLQNFFVPQLKLLSKTRVGAKYIRKYGPPKTPYQRLLESKNIGMGKKEELRRKYKTLNPFKLKQGMNKKLNEFRLLVEEIQAEKKELLKMAA